MKSITKLISVVIATLCVTSFAQQYTPYVVSMTAADKMTNVFTSRVNIGEIQVGAGAGLVDVRFFDVASEADPYFGSNYVTSSYISKAAYATNIASSFVDMGGITNWSTNAGYFTYSVTNAAATNVMSPIWSTVVQPNTVQTFSANVLATRGLSIACPTNATIVLWYNRGQ